MNDLALSAQEGKTINLAIHRDLATGQWFLDQIEVRCADMRSMTKFTSKTTLQKALSQDFYDLLKPYLPFNLAQQVRSISGEAVRLQAVVLEDLRVLTQNASNGIQRVIIRFNKVTGRVFEILNAKLRPDRTLDDVVTEGVSEAIEARDSRHTAIPRHHPLDLQNTPDRS